MKDVEVYMGPEACDALFSCNSLGSNTEPQYSHFTFCACGSKFISPVQFGHFIIFSPLELFLLFFVYYIMYNLLF